jgi:ankyrin repeat protein
MGNKPSQQQQQHNNVLVKQLTLDGTNIKEIFTTLKKGADPNILINGRPLIFELASTLYNRPDDEGKASLIIQYIYGKGVDLNQVNGYNGVTPLITATQRGNIGIVKTLVSMGADINKADYNGVTPLITAILDYYKSFDDKYYKIIEILLNARANIGTEDKTSNTPLIYASLKKDVGMVELLLKDANELNDICVKTKNGSTALSIVTDKIKDLQNNHTNEEDNRDEIIQKLIVEKIINLSYNGVDPENFEKYGKQEQQIIETSRLLSVTTLFRDNYGYISHDTTEDLVQMLLAEFNEKASEPKGGKKKAPFTKRKRKRKHLTKKRLLKRR